MEDEIGASPAEQLAAEVASEANDNSEVTADDVAEVLNLPKPTKSTESDDSDDADEDSDDAANDDDADEEVTEDSEDDEELDEEDDQEEVVDDANEKQFVLKVTDANGKEFTLSPDDDLEKILEDFEPKSNGQIFSILKQLQDLGSAKEKYTADQEESTKQAAFQERVTSVRTNWDKEIVSLQGEKRIPVEADGKIPPRVTEVFTFIREQNEKRLKEGRPLLESFEDALDKLELKESKDETIKKNKEEKVLARKRGGVVGGSSAPTSSGVANYKRGARTAVEALRQMKVLG